MKIGHFPFSAKQELMRRREEEKQQSERQILPTCLLGEKCWCNFNLTIKALAIKTKKCHLYMIKLSLNVIYHMYHPWKSCLLESRERIDIKFWEILNDRNKIIYWDFYFSYDLLQSITFLVDLWHPGPLSTSQVLFGVFKWHTPDIEWGLRSYRNSLSYIYP